MSSISGNYNRIGITPAQSDGGRISGDNAVSFQEHSELPSLGKQISSVKEPINRSAIPQKEDVHISSESPKTMASVANVLTKGNEKTETPKAGGE